MFSRCPTLCLFSGKSEIVKSIFNSTCKRYNQVFIFQQYFSFRDGSRKMAAVHLQTVRYLIKDITIKKRNMLNEENTKSILVSLQIV